MQTGVGVTFGGWIDTDNNIPVAIDNYSSVTEDTSNSRGGSPYFDYSCPAVLMESANGTKYWVKMGYGGHGHSFQIWAENTKPYELKGSWEVVFGTYTLANSANIDHVSLPQGISFGIPSSTTLTIYVSNNNGSTWETYDKDSTDTHVFSTSGTQLRLKFSANGQPDKAPYYSGNGGDGPLKIFLWFTPRSSKRLKHICHLLMLRRLLFNLNNLSFLNNFLLACFLYICQVLHIVGNPLCI